MRVITVFLFVCCGLLGAGCASNQDRPNDPSMQVKDPGFYQQRMPNVGFIEVYDPWEGFNRRVYGFNRQADRFVLMPLVKGYRAITPKLVRTGVTNFWNNLGEVETFAASLLQLKFQKAARSAGRFLLNSTAGVGGLGDPASGVGLLEVNEDFGQVLGHWGVQPGPYLVIPFLGPSSVRDGFGLAADHGIAIGVDFAGIPTARSDKLPLSGFYAISRRESVPFRYGQLKSPFEYEMVRFAISEAREILVKE